ncbi:hypothetical protein CAOG_000031 [Capsaspora owczarzaki ATCC 30864]|uniref:Uncharacterized protein n=2 Tax=Capsaspora owczarzaki (strain ATCC 30864) TaxID=595528 RepID=A0A0D2WG79_CAPO3|nr:hypothetical protein CAOG_000031 [Capsaspora owczarzaki ATCC 30864]
MDVSSRPVPVPVPVSPGAESTNSDDNDGCPHAARVLSLDNLAIIQSLMDQHVVKRRQQLAKARHSLPSSSSASALSAQADLTQYKPMVTATTTAAVPSNASAAARDTVNGGGDGQPAAEALALERAIRYCAECNAQHHHQTAPDTMATMMLAPDAAKALAAAAASLAQTNTSSSSNSHPSIATLQLAQALIYDMYANTDVLAKATYDPAAGSDVWVCLSPGCRHVGCGQQSRRHGLAHFETHKHPLVIRAGVPMIWCYACNNEVFIASSETTDSAPATPIDDHDQPSHANHHNNNHNHNHANANQPTPMDTDDDERTNRNRGSGGELQRHHRDRTAGSTSSGGGSSSKHSKDTGLGGHRALQVHPRALMAELSPNGGISGLNNLGNTCYMNAPLQALAHLRPLLVFFTNFYAPIRPVAHKLFHNQSTLDHLQMTNDFCELLSNLWSGQSMAISPSQVVHDVKRLNPSFRGYAHQDAQEFLRTLMSALHDDLKRRVHTVPTAAAAADQQQQQQHQHQQQQQAHAAEKASLDGNDSITTSNRGGSEDGSEDSTTTAAAAAAGGLTSSEHHSGSGSRRSFGQLRRSLVKRMSRKDKRKSLEGQNPHLPSTQESAAEDGSKPATPALSPSTSQQSTATSTAPSSGPSKRFSSVISSVFEGQLRSEVECAKCHNISVTVDSFWDLNIPIASGAVRRKDTRVINGEDAQGSANQVALVETKPSWSILGILSHFNPFSSWKPVALEACLSAFCDTEELVGSERYRCEHCNKLCDALKTLSVHVLPEVLCLHIKRFRHDSYLSSKLSQPVQFPLEGLDMRPFLAPGSTETNTLYTLNAVVSHRGGVNSGHYVAYAQHPQSGRWFEYDDSDTTEVSVQDVLDQEAYILFYSRESAAVDKERSTVAQLMERDYQSASDASSVRYISKQWLASWMTLSNPGSISNGDLFCEHGGVQIHLESVIQTLVTPVPVSVFQYLQNVHQGGPEIISLGSCSECWREAEQLQQRRDEETAAITRLDVCNEQGIWYIISAAWLKQWLDFKSSRDPNVLPPGPISNDRLLDANGVPLPHLKKVTHYRGVNQKVWEYFMKHYGGGPTMVRKVIDIHSAPDLPENDV